MSPNRAPELITLRQNMRNMLGLAAACTQTVPRRLAGAASQVHLAGPKPMLAAARRSKGILRSPIAKFTGRCEATRAASDRSACCPGFPSALCLI